MGQAPVHLPGDEQSRRTERGAGVQRRDHGHRMRSDGNRDAADPAAAEAGSEGLVVSG